MRTSSTMRPAARCRRTSWSSARSATSAWTLAQAGRPADRQAQARRRLEHRPAGHPQPDGRPATASLQLRRRHHPEGPLPQRPEPDLLPADLHPRPRRSWHFAKDDLEALRHHLEPGGGTLFADAACGSPAFDAAFRRFVAELLPDIRSCRSQPTTSCSPTRSAFDLRDCQYTQAAGGGRDFPKLEGVKINDHWAIIYSKFDIGCALERHTGIDCKGYTHRKRRQDRGNIVIYATLP